MNTDKTMVAKGFSGKNFPILNKGNQVARSTRGLLATDHVILNHGQVTWTTPELAPPLLTTTPHQREDVSALDRFNVHRCPTRRVFSGTWIELMTCLPWLDTLTTGLPQPPTAVKGCGPSPGILQRCKLLEKVQLINSLGEITMRGKAFSFGRLDCKQSHIVRVYDAGHGKSGVFHSAEWHDGDWSSDGIREAWLWFFIWVESLSFLAWLRAKKLLTDWMLGTVNIDSDWLPRGLRFKLWGGACPVGRAGENY
ncbi:uncharacterized protein TNCV_470051 [Trichonephila clavipes]|nr:uncharacterized protein TNCV_470051 [Trichonephila clavipes]